MSDQSRVLLVLPSLKISGGTLELLRLADDLASQKRGVDIVVMWRSPHEASIEKRSVWYLSEWRTNARYAALQVPELVRRFSRLVKSLTSAAGRSNNFWIFSHYATFPLALCVPRDRRWFFVQDMEWRFVQNRAVAAVLKGIILFSYKRGHLISANSYLTSQMALLKLNVDAEVAIWADPRFHAPIQKARDIDLVMVLRKGDHKRLDLYLELLALVHAQNRPWKLAVITPESDIVPQIKGMVDVCLLRPSIEQMQQLYARSRCFLHLSEHEGFGLPPLEAMGSGCVPICRDSGGIRAYMAGDLEALIAPKRLTMVQIIERVSELVHDSAKMTDLSDLVAKVFVDGLVRARNRSETLAHLQFG
jgi:glycosyltransferase involved in cell wall biosynthesis